MKKLFISILLFIFIIGNLQVQNIYANYENTLNDKKETSIDTLENVGEIVTKTIDGLGNKINNNEIDTQLLGKREEVIEFISYTKEKIQNENSVGDINKIVLDAKKSLVLKVVSGVTQYENIGDNIDESIKNNSKKFDTALETIQDSLKNDEFYNLQIKTKFSEIEVKNKLNIFDEKLKINFLYNEGSINYFELNIYNDSIFKNEILENIESGIIPENLIGIDVVNPEVFTIESIVGENLDSTWGVKSYNTELYFPLISNSDYKIKIGVIDTGIDYNHVDLKGKVLEGYDFVNNDNDAIDDQGHGTHVAGTIGANLNNKGIIGINPYVELVPLKICNSSGFCPSYAVTKALSYSTENKLDIVNMSLGGKGDINNNSICDGIKSYTDAGGIAVVAAGNSNIDTSLFVPGGCTSAITVAAIDQNNNKAIFSNYGTKVDVAAPGVNIYSTSLNGTYKNLSGTSMSTPHIVGIISILKTLKRDLNTNDVKQLFKNNQIQVISDKYIGGNINLSKIITNLIEIKEEILEVVNIESINTEIDDSEIVKDLKFKSNQKQLDNLSIDLVDNGYDEIGNIEVANSIVDFGDDSIEINELGDFEISRNKLTEEVIGKLEYNFSSGDKIYDLNGNLIDLNVKINNEGEEKTIGSKVDENFDINSLLLNQSGEQNDIENLSINNNDNSIENEIVNQIYLDNYSINSIEEINQLTNTGILINSDEIISDIVSESGAVLNNSEDYNDDLFYDGFEILNSNIVNTNEINYNFGILNNYLNYEGFITKGSTKYSLQTTSKGTVGTDYIEAKTTDNNITLNSINDYNFDITGKKITNFKGKIKATLGNTSSGRGQGSNFGLIDNNNGQSIFNLQVITVQKPVLDRAKNYVGSNYLCSVTGNISERQCYNHGTEIGRFITFSYNKGNGYYGILSYKLPDTLSGEKIFDFDYNFINGDVIIKVIDNTTLLQTITFNSKNIIGYNYNNFSNFSYNLFSYATNGTNQKIYPYNLKLETENIIKEGLNIKSINKLNEKINLENANNYELFLSGSYFSKTPNIVNLYYSLDGVNYNKYDFDFLTKDIASEIDINKKINFDFSNIDDGIHNLYIKLSDGTINSNIYNINLVKDLTGLNYPTNFIVSSFENNKINYKWDSDNNLNFDKYILIDENNNIVIDNINPNINNINENFTVGGLNYSRKICKVLGGNKSCSGLIFFKTPYIRNYELEYKKTLNVNDLVLESGYVLENSNQNISTLTINNNIFTINGLNLGNNIIYIKNNGYITHILNIKVIPEILTTYEGRSIYFGGKYITFNNFDSSVISFYSEYSGRSHIPSTNHYINGLKPGKTNADMYINGVYQKTYTFNIIEKPKETILNVNVTSGFDNEIIFQENIDKYRIEKNSVINYYLFTKSLDRIILGPYNEGEGIITLYDGNNFPIYTIKVISSPMINTHILNVSDKIESRFNENYSYQELNSNIADLTHDGNTGIITGVSPGKAYVKFFKDNKYRRLFDITVNPIPTPIEINCEIIKGEQCYFEIRNNGFYYNESSVGVVDIDSSRSSVRVDTNLSGTAKIYVKSEFGNYVTHILNIKSNPIPPVIKTCETIVGGKCETYNYGSDRGYTYKVSKPGIVGLTSNKYSYLGNPTTYENLHIDGISNGEVEIYVYQNTDHIATIKATILPKITLEFSENEVLLKETEEKELQVIKGYGNYRDYYVDGESDRPSWDKEILEFSSNNDGKLDLRGLKPGITYPAVVDKYGNTGRVKVTIEDKTLKLDNYETSINPGEEIYVKVLESYGSVNKIRKTNNNVLIYKHYFADGSEGVKIVGKYTGTTVVSLIDSEVDETRGQIGNERTILINIGGNVINPDYKEYEFYDNGMDPCVTDLSGDLHDGKCDSIVEDVIEDEVSEIGFEELIYSKKETDSGISGIYFKTKGNPKEVGIEFIDENNEVTRQIIEKENDSIYLIGLEDENKIYGEKFQIYLKDDNDNIIYYTDNYLAFNDNVALADIENIKINAINKDLIAKYVQNKFLNIKYTFKKAYEENKGYADGAGEAFNEAVEDLKDSPSDVIKLLNTSGKVLVQYIRGERSHLDDFNYMVALGDEALQEIKNAYNEFEQFKEYLTEYNIQFVEGYVGASSAMIGFGPGKLKGVKSVDRVVLKTKNITKLGILNDIEVKNTLERIKKGEGKYIEDGQIFKNLPPIGKETSLLPNKTDGYYTEWTVDTQGLNYRGKRRIVLGKEGEMYYTNDHYASFIKIN